MNITDKIRFKSSGAVYTVDEFATKYANGNIEEGLKAMEILLQRGDATLADRKTPEQVVLERAAKKQNVVEQAQNFDAEEENLKDRRAEMKREGKATYDKIKVDYPTVFEATKAQNFYEEELRLNDIELSTRGGQVSLIFYDITDAELNFINRTYKADKVIASTMGLVNSGAEKVTKSIDYTAKKVAVPILGIGAKGVASILKSAASVVTKTGATLVNAGAKGARDTYTDITTDPDIIKARRELIETGSSIKRGIANKSNGTSSGITIM